MATDVGTGSTITLGHTNDPYDVSAELTSIEWSGWSAESVETTHMGTATGRTYISGDLYDAGELSVEGHFDPTEALPKWTEVGVVTIVFAGNGTPHQWRANAFITEYSVSSPLEDKMTFSATLKFTSGVAKA